MCHIAHQEVLSNLQSVSQEKRVDFQSFQVTSLGKAVPEDLEHDELALERNILDLTDFEINAIALFLVSRNSLSCLVTLDNDAGLIFSLTLVMRVLNAGWFPVS